MAKSKPQGRKDLNQTAFAVVQQATGDVVSDEKKLYGKKADSRKGGLRGGKSRMALLTEEQRKELAKKAAMARWNKSAPAENADADTSKLTK